MAKDSEIVLLGSVGTNCYNEKHNTNFKNWEIEETKEMRNRYCEFGWNKLTKCSYHKNAKPQLSFNFGMKGLI